ncbi:MAG: hypothetical protein FWD43_06335, partial [Coriobacteriia bacterium]|nr:hypothetical protein [Coriobacteriia bacterium]
MENKENGSANKAARSFGAMWLRLLKRDKLELNVLEEEALRTPAQTIMINLFHKKMAIIGFCGFVAIVLFCFVGAALRPLPLTYTEFTNSNLRPGRNFLNYPASLANKNVVKIVSGVSFSVALDSNGDLTIWGTECNLELAGVADYIMNIPDYIRDAHIVDIESGGAHVIAEDINGFFYAWGHFGHGQTEIPYDVHMEMAADGFSGINQMAAMTRWTALLGDTGYVYL